MILFTSSDQQDESLYRAAKAGDQRAFRLLYRRYESPLFGFLMRRCASRQDSEELLQETMLALMAGPTLRFETGGVGAWLYRVAANRAANRHRGLQRKRSALELLASDKSQSGFDQGSAEAHQLSQESDLSRALATIPKELAEVVALRQGGASYEAIAAQQQVPLGTVKSRLHHAVRRLRGELKKWHAP